MRAPHFFVHSLGLGRAITSCFAALMQKGASGMLGRAMVRAIRFYQKHLSGAKRAPTCRFYPTCSQYAVEAIQRHGALCGGALALWRILRCNPLGKHGYDPVPQTLPFPFGPRQR